MILIALALILLSLFGRATSDHGEVLWWIYTVGLWVGVWTFAWNLFWAFMLWWLPREGPAARWVLKRVFGVAEKE